MPPVQKYQREDIIHAAYELVKNEGIEAVNARRIARELSCSVQPIYRNFSSMDELKKAVVERVYQTYVDYMKMGLQEEKPYLGMGLAYIRFAKDFPNFFWILFMNASNLSPENFLQSDGTGRTMLHSGGVFSGLDGEEQKQFGVKVWIFTHGIASLMAAKTVNLPDDEIKELLQKTVQEMLRGFLGDRKGENEKNE